ncbi:peptide deformylase [Clostridium botulinum]|uniref:Peptide deformylase n=1 Tax=Clostridium botulinum C/D str. DC5 TaxID=1443128 RepID=A0A0A0IK56_CLOBO|nr:peptide deformylase [Clostridium botulinum]KEI01468.1 peptide deformylase [Clostridium botulinum C/D str. BKT75002]KEI07802.1 peptide deformylase [Clostridium botulinum C/D str. BKT2873]KGM94140.1 peptide deformylase [Clostridium botulinum D str. CCUG 7971]KGN01298.1 peptide deformylase [Clostridium botulinum C/D str. DC5]KOC49593.1 peptide deformylase [Clostridium botulinum]
MALRNIRVNEDTILRKTCKKVDEINERILTLIEDMKETMYEADGVGLAAPQIGVLKRLVVIDVGNGPMSLINPEIISSEGSQTDYEGCLSLPGKQGKVTRPYNVVAKALNEKGEEVEIHGEGLLARAICHELDHLDGVLFMDKVVKGKEEE